MVEIEKKEIDLNVLKNKDQSRAISEVQGAIVVAQRCPRNEQACFVKIINDCKRVSLAKQAMYSFPRGGQTITGPSIRLAESIARSWGNIQYGIREIETCDDYTKYETFCWDVQSNVRASRVYTQKHGRWTRKKGFQKVSDPRDAYEIVASGAARRLRSCILEIIPGDIIDEAIETCEKTLKGQSNKPLSDRVRNMVVAFNNFGVTEEMIEKNLGHNLKSVSEIELVNLIKIYQSLKENASKVGDWFKREESEEIEKLNKKLSEKKELKNYAPEKK